MSRENLPKLAFKDESQHHPPPPSGSVLEKDSNNMIQTKDFAMKIEQRFKERPPTMKDLEPTIELFDFATEQVSTVTVLEHTPMSWWISVSADEEWILYCEAPAPTSELMLVENFR